MCQNAAFLCFVMSSGDISILSGTVSVNVNNTHLFGARIAAPRLRFPTRRDVKLQFGLNFWVSFSSRGWHALLRYYCHLKFS